MNCVPMALDPQFPGTSEDAVLGGRLRLRQPLRGHRVGHDAILLAAACPACAGEHAVEFGAGVGAAGFALAMRVTGLTVTLVEIDATLCALAEDNARLNRLDDRVAVRGLDVGDAVALTTLAAADRVLMNPPFHDPVRHQISPDAGKKLAYAGGPAVLASWIAAAARLLKPQGTLTLIWRADGIEEVRRALAREFGSLCVLPVHPKPGAKAIRVLVRAAKGGDAAEIGYDGLVLSGDDGRPSAAAESILRAGDALPIAKI